LFTGIGDRDDSWQIYSFQQLGAVEIVVFWVQQVIQVHDYATKINQDFKNGLNLLRIRRGFNILVTFIASRTIREGRMALGSS
jgi:hypothetical protein